MDIPLGELKRLPPGASYNSKSGRAGINLHVAGDTLTATASCDSLERLVEYYEGLYMSAAERLEAGGRSIEARAEQGPGLPAKIMFAAGMITGALTITLIKKIKKRIDIWIPK